MGSHDQSDWVVVLSDVPQSQVGEALALLGSQGIDGDWEPEHGSILVASRDEEVARRLLSEIDFDREPKEKDEEERPPTVVWSNRGAGALLTVALACVVVFWSTHVAEGTPDRQRLLDHGAISWSLVEQGDLWRLLAAVFVHFDGAHLLTNLLTLALVGPPLAHHLGAGRFAAIFVLTGVAGNALSHVFMPTMGLKAGASGAVAGVLGALAGQTLRPEFRGRFRRWQILGALGAVYAMLVGAGPGSDNVAHAGGLLAGLLLGRLVTPLAPGSDQIPASAGSAR